MVNIFLMLLGTLFLLIAYNFIPTIIAETILGFIFLFFGGYLFFRGLVYKSKKEKE